MCCNDKTVCKIDKGERDDDRNCPQDLAGYKWWIHSYRVQMEFIVGERRSNVRASDDEVNHSANDTNDGRNIDFTILLKLSPQNRRVKTSHNTRHQLRVRLHPKQVYERKQGNIEGESVRVPNGLEIGSCESPTHHDPPLNDTFDLRYALHLPLQLCHHHNLLPAVRAAVCMRDALIAVFQHRLSLENHSWNKNMRDLVTSCFWENFHPDQMVSRSTTVYNWKKTNRKRKTLYFDDFVIFSIFWK